MNKSTIKLSKYKNLVAASILLPTLMFGFIVWFDYSNVFREAEKHVISTCAVFQQHAVNVFETHQLIAERVHERLKGMSWDAIGRSSEIHSYLKQIQKEYPQVHSIWLADSTGTVRNASLSLPASPLNVADRDYFIALRESGASMFVGQIIKGRVIKRLLFNIGYRRQNESGSFDGVIVLTADPEYFNHFWNIASPVKEFTAALVRGDGNMLARAPNLTPEMLTLPPGSPFVKERLQADKGLYYGVSANDSYRKVYAFNKVDNYNVYVVYGMKTRTVVQVWLRHLLYYGCIYIFATTALSIMSLLALRHAQREQNAVNELNQSNNELERRIAERTAELREKDQMLLQQSRLAAMGEMINNIAHQWRQPLNLLGMNIQCLSLLYDTDKFSKESLETIVKDTMALTRHMSQTIDDFRNFFRPDKEKTDFNVKQAIQQTINLVEDGFKQNQIKIVTEIDADAWIYGYPNEFSQVILNVLQNARDALVEREITDKLISIAASVAKSKTVITISDNAGGIREDIIDRIFEPYFSTKGVQGTGIGLFMSKSIIETNMGGSITVSNSAAGAVFRIEV